MQSGNALITHHSGEWSCNTDNRTPANASKLRQGHHALGVDGKLLTELLGLIENGLPKLLHIRSAKPWFEPFHSL